MSHPKHISGIMFLIVFTACASTRPTPTTGPPSAQETAEQVCVGVSEERRATSLCFDTDEILRVERIPVATHRGDVLTGARMVFRAAPDRTPESFQHLIDCQLARNFLGDSQNQYPRMAYCPLAIKGVIALVLPVADGLAVEVKPKDAPTSHRLSHTLVHGSTAVQLARFESLECRGIEPKARAACPLVGPVTAINDLPRGVRVEFAPSVSVDAVLAGMRCHFSFAQARDFSDEATGCPLYMRGLRLDGSTDGKAIDITISLTARVDEVRKRVREEAVFVIATANRE